MNINIHPTPISCVEDSPYAPRDIRANTTQLEQIFIFEEANWASNMLSWLQKKRKGFEPFSANDLPPKFIRFEESPLVKGGWITSDPAEPLTHYAFTKEFVRLCHAASPAK